MVNGTQGGVVNLMVDDGLGHLPPWLSWSSDEQVDDYRKQQRYGRKGEEGGGIERVWEGEGMERGGVMERGGMKRGGGMKRERGRIVRRGGGMERVGRARYKNRLTQS